jgi:hypothetical protein
VSPHLDDAKVANNAEFSDLAITFHKRGNVISLIDAHHQSANDAFGERIGQSAAV